MQMPPRGRGRPRAPADERKRSRHWATDDARFRRAQAAAAREGISLSAFVSGAVDDRLARPDYAAIVRVALDDAATRERLAALPAPAPSGSDSLLAWLEWRASQAGSKEAWLSILARIECDQK
jgi:hypothetical protein